MQILLDLVIVFIVMIFAGYFVARHHGRWRNIGLGAALGTATPSLPGFGDDEDTSEDSWDEGVSGPGEADSSSAGPDSDP